MVIDKILIRMRIMSKAGTFANDNGPTRVIIIGSRGIK